MPLWTYLKKRDRRSPRPLHGIVACTKRSTNNTACPGCPVTARTGRSSGQEPGTAATRIKLVHTAARTTVATIESHTMRYKARGIRYLPASNCPKTLAAEQCHLSGSRGPQVSLDQEARRLLLPSGCQEGRQSRHHLRQLASVRTALTHETAGLLHAGVPAKRHSDIRKYSAYSSIIRKY